MRKWKKPPEIPLEDEKTKKTFYAFLAFLAFSFPSPSLSFLPNMPKGDVRLTIISFSRSICREELAALIGVTGKPYPSCLSYHSHPIRPFRAPSPRGEGCDTRIASSKKGGEAATRALNLEPNESKVKRGCEEMRIHFFAAPFGMRYFTKRLSYSRPP